MTFRWGFNLLRNKLTPSKPTTMQNIAYKILFTIHFHSKIIQNTS